MIADKKQLLEENLDFLLILNDDHPIQAKFDNQNIRCEIKL